MYTVYNVGQQWSPASELWNARVLASRKKLVEPPVGSILFSEVTSAWSIVVKWPVGSSWTESPMLPEAVVLMLWAEQTTAWRWRNASWSTTMMQNYQTSSTFGTNKYLIVLGFFSSRDWVTRQNSNILAKITSYMGLLVCGFSKRLSDKMSSLPFPTRFRWKHMGKITYFGERERERDIY